ncbi:glycoside hydrolase family 3 C-terminal domain-containing protein [Streptomyces sp. NBC_01515]|uniref:beta-glucosidase H n=1 Tax=Streptomyces sp. NBC_01515 TaxID=2903890 RepID=UPI00386FD942
MTATDADTDTDSLREAAVGAALARLDLDTKAQLLAGHDMWSLPSVPAIGLRAVVMSDGPIGVRGTNWSPDDPSVALPSPTALAASWDPELARRAGRLLAQEARRKGVDVLLAPTVNLHRTPLGGRHFECFSEDPLLTGVIGTGYVRGVQDGGVGTTVKHFVANDSETERLTLDAKVGERALRELYLSPFETIVADARPWGVMSAYNGVNGSTMTEHRYLQNEILRGEWGFDGVVVSDWMAARDTVRAVEGGLDIAMPGPRTVYGEALATAVREGRVAEGTVDEAVRRVLRLAARVGALDSAPPAVCEPPVEADGRALAREIARRSFVLLKNEGAVLPLRPRELRRVALIGDTARHARVMGGGSATVFPERVVTPLAGLRHALPPAVELLHAQGADPRTRLAPAAEGFTLRSVYRDADGIVLADLPQPDGRVMTVGSLPAGVDAARLHSVEITGTLTPDRTGAHTFGVTGYGEVTLLVAGRTICSATRIPDSEDPFLAFTDPAEQRHTLDLTAGVTVTVSLLYVPFAKGFDDNIAALSFGLSHRPPTASGAELIEEAAALAAAADVAIVVVATTEEVESEGFDRADLKLPGHQDELVSRVAAANPRTVVIVNAGSPVEMPWRDEVAAVMLCWFPGQEAGHALADVLLGAEEPGGRLPTTWPAATADCPVLDTTPVDGVLSYDEGAFIGYRAWARQETPPAYWFGHGLGYTSWSYEQAKFTPGGDGDTLGTLRVHVRNTGERAGREVVQVYLEAGACPEGEETVAVAEQQGPARRLVGLATVEAGPGRAVTAEIRVPRRATRIWDTDLGDWSALAGRHRLRAGRSFPDLRVETEVDLTGKPDGQVDMAN